MKRRDSLLAVALAVGVALFVAVGLVGWAAGRYTAKTNTVTVAGPPEKF